MVVYKVLMRSTRDGLLCPHRIIDDLGSGFALGTALGSIIYFIKGKLRRRMECPQEKEIYWRYRLIKETKPFVWRKFRYMDGTFWLLPMSFSSLYRKRLTYESSSCRRPHRRNGQYSKWKTECTERSYWWRSVHRGFQCIRNFYDEKATLDGVQC